MLVLIPHQQPSTAVLEKESVMNEILKVAIGVFVGSLAATAATHLTYVGIAKAAAKKAEKAAKKAEKAEAEEAKAEEAPAKKKAA